MISYYKHRTRKKTKKVFKVSENERRYLNFLRYVQIFRLCPIITPSKIRSVIIVCERTCRSIYLESSAYHAISKEVLYIFGIRIAFGNMSAAYLI